VSAETPAVLTETFLIFLTPSGNRFLPNPFRISSHKSFSRRRGMVRVTDSIVKQALSEQKTLMCLL